VAKTAFDVELYLICGKKMLIYSLDMYTISSREQSMMSSYVHHQYDTKISMVATLRLALPSVALFWLQKSQIQQ
jgi:hypothetical protein